jgi:hypothetical protein
MKLLSENLDFNSYPDALWELGSQFIVSRGYEQEIDIDSLMVLLWKMQQRIEKLESLTTPEFCGETCDKTSTLTNE